MATSNGWHLYDLAVPQFDAVVLAKDAGIRHPLVLATAEPSSW
jgi:hypothetical protein